jgi:hypothetical protein
MSSSRSAIGFPGCFLIEPRPSGEPDLAEDDRPSGPLQDRARRRACPASCGTDRPSIVASYGLYGALGARSSPMLVKIRRVSAATVPCAGSPVAGLIAAIPERKTRSPARMAGESGRPGRPGRADPARARRLQARRSPRHLAREIVRRRAAAAAGPPRPPRTAGRLATVSECGASPQCPTLLSNSATASRRAPQARPHRVRPRVAPRGRNG